MAHSNGLTGGFNKGIIYKDRGRVQGKEQGVLKDCEDGKSGKPLLPLNRRRQGNCMATRLGENGSICRRGLPNRSFGLWWRDPRHLW